MGKLPYENPLRQGGFMNVVIDTSILLISIPSHSRYHVIIESFNKRLFKLVVSTPILLEYEEILSEKANPLIAFNILEAIQEAPNVTNVNVHFNWNMIAADPDDNKFTDAYVNGNADYLVSNDAHFNVIKTFGFPKINILSPDEFISMLPTIKS
jgi:uncharacterized protein